MPELNNPVLWAVIVGTLAYCGVIALCARLGIRTANWLQLRPTATLVGRVVRDWHSWFVPAMLVFLVAVACVADHRVIAASFLVAPFAFLSAVGIYREGRA